MTDDEDTAEFSAEALRSEMDGGDEAMFDLLSRKWQYYCPWCGRPATLNTVKPLTINCDECEATTEIRGIT